MIRYRTFRNGDPPSLVQLWNACFPNRGAAPLPGTTLLEYFAFAKPYFDPASLLLALEDERIVGCALNGFGPRADGSALDTSVGVICCICVHPDQRRKGIATELLRRSETYLRSKGATQIDVGTAEPNYPFGFALYGGARSSGILASDALAAQFLPKRGYDETSSYVVLQRAMNSPLTIADGRFAAHRAQLDIHGGPRKKSSWYVEAAVGPIDVYEYLLTERQTGSVLARASLWEMETFNRKWNEHAVGLMELSVLPERRRQGLAKFLLAQMLRHLQDQFFSMMEAHCPAGDSALLALFTMFGFQVVDHAHIYTLARIP